MRPAGSATHPPRARLAVEAALVAALALLLTTWFAGVPRGISPAVPAALVAGLLAWRLSRAWRPLPKPAPETLAVLLLALVYRIPALVWPWGFVNRDGFYAAMVASRLLQGARPAPVFTEGAVYQGTLKAHLAALLALVGPEDLAWLVAAAGVVFSLTVVAATMALARRVAGRAAAVGAGLYLAVGPKFFTTLSLTATGQYVEVLALGGLALALLARLLGEQLAGVAARGGYLAIGLLLGAAFWQQPAALAYAAAVAGALALRRRTWSDPWVLLVPAGFAVGALPLVVWNLQHAWATREIFASAAGGPADVLAGLPRTLRRTWRLSFPILSGVSPGHPLRDWPGVVSLAAALPAGLLAVVMLLRRHELARGLRRLAPTPAFLAPLLIVATLAIFWAVPAGLVHLRPRYLLPLVPATAVHVGVVVAWLWPRTRLIAGALLALLVALNALGSVPRLLAARRVQDWGRELVSAVEATGARTGFADFSIAAPVTMFTGERVVISPRLGPTPCFESPVHARIVDAAGADAYLLLPGEDPAPFAARLRALGVDFQLTREPVPIFHHLSRRVGLDEVIGHRALYAPPPEDE